GLREGEVVPRISDALRGVVGDLLRQALNPVVDTGQRVREVKRLLGVEDRAGTELLRQVHRDVLREGYRAGVRLHPTALRLESLVPGDDVEEILALLLGEPRNHLLGHEVIFSDALARRDARLIGGTRRALGFRGGGRA